MPLDIFGIALSIVEASDALSDKTDAIPTGANYTRRFGLHPVVKRRTLSVQERLAAVMRKVLLLAGNQEGKLADDYVMDGIDLALRRSDRAEGMIEPKRKSTGKRKRKHLESMPSMGSLLSTEPKRARVAAEGHLDVISEQRENACFDDTALYRRKKDNHTFVFTPSELRDKKHALEPFRPETYKVQRKDDDFRLTPSTQTTDIKTLREYIRIADAIEDKTRQSDVSIIPHPYEAELTALTDLYAQRDDVWGYECMNNLHKKLFKISKPHLYTDILLAKDPIYVDDDEKLRYLIDTVLENGLDEIAVDVEHHSRFSYRGFTCLIQLSTCKEDYIIDPQKITIMNDLNELFACPSILKILHGCNKDVLWLQSDFGLYLVNVFDTFFASSLLATPGGHSLANLVDFYCQIKLNKKQQVSDWRVRPLSPEQQSYARCDTHYLLYIFHCMRNQILGRMNDNAIVPTYEAGMQSTSRGRKQLMQVLCDSRQLCLQKMSYSPPPFSTKAERIILKSCLPVKTAVFHILTFLLAWRDLKARALDVSPSSIVTDPMLLTIATKCPRTRSALQQVMQMRNPNCEEMLTVITQAIISLPSDAFQTYHMPVTSQPKARAAVKPMETQAKLQAKETETDETKMETDETKIKTDETMTETAAKTEKVDDGGLNAVKFDSRIERCVIDRHRSLPKVIVRGTFTTRTTKGRLVTQTFGRPETSTTSTPLTKKTGKKRKVSSTPGKETSAKKTAETVSGSKAKREKRETRQETDTTPTSSKVKEERRRKENGKGNRELEAEVIVSPEIAVTPKSVGKKERKRGETLTPTKMEKQSSLRRSDSASVASVDSKAVIKKHKKKKASIV